MVFRMNADVIAKDCIITDFQAAKSCSIMPMTTQTNIIANDHTVSYLMQTTRQFYMGMKSQRNIVSTYQSIFRHGIDITLVPDIKILTKMQFRWTYYFSRRVDKNTLKSSQSYHSINHRDQFCPH